MVSITFRELNKIINAGKYQKSANTEMSSRAKPGAPLVNLYSATKNIPIKFHN